MTREEAIKELTRLRDNGDTEGDHLDADYILCNFLVFLGYQDIVNAYHEVPKWYA